MTDFKTQQELYQWLSDDDTRRVKSVITGREVGYKNGSLCDFTKMEESRFLLRFPGNWRKVKPKITYIKSMKQLIEEYPTYEFTEDGDLDLDCFSSDPDYRLKHKYFKFLGKEASSLDKKCWPKRFLEEREV